MLSRLVSLLVHELATLTVFRFLLRGYISLYAKMVFVVNSCLRKALQTFPRYARWEQIACARCVRRRRPANRATSTNSNGSTESAILSLPSCV